MQNPNDAEFKDGINLYGKILNKLVGDSLKRMPKTTILDRDDLHQIALHTLWKCMQKFDISRGVKFSTYLYFCLSRKLRDIQEKEWKDYNKRKLWEQDNGIETEVGEI